MINFILRLSEQYLRKCMCILNHIKLASKYEYDYVNVRFIYTFGDMYLVRYIVGVELCFKVKLMFFRVVKYKGWF